MRVHCIVTGLMVINNIMTVVGIEMAMCLDHHMALLTVILTRLVLRHCYNLIFGSIINYKC